MYEFALTVNDDNIVNKMSERWKAAVSNSMIEKNEVSSFVQEYTTFQMIISNINQKKPQENAVKFEQVSEYHSNVTQVLTFY